MSRTQIVGVIDTVAVKPGDEVKKGFKYNDPTAKQGVTEAEMQKKMAQKEVTIVPKAN